MVKVSVIVPVYNVEIYLADCLDSVLQQTLKDIEIICINDGSTDKSPEILAEYARKDSRIIIISQENKGLGSARNRGLEVATGEYVAFLDSDDWVDKDYYEKLYNTAVKYGAEIACSGYKRCSEKEERIWLKFKNERIYTKAEDKYRVVKMPKSCYVWNKIYKLSLLKMKNLFFTCVFVEDVMFSHQALFFLPKMVTVPDTYYNYRKNNFSFVATPSKVKQKSWDDEFEKAIEFITSNKINIPLTSYHPDNTIRGKFFNITLFKIKVWKSVKIVFILGVPVLKIVESKIK